MKTRQFVRSTPGQPVRVVRQSGARIELALGRWPFCIRWIAEYSGYIQNRQFQEGLFVRWEYTHLFETDGARACNLEERIEYALQFGFAGYWLLGGVIERKLDRLFQYRHRITGEEYEHS